MTKHVSRLANNDDLQRRETLAREQREKELAAFRWVMSDPKGRLVMWRLFEKAGLFRSSFTGNSETFFKEGMRNLGLIFQNDVLDACPELYFEMLQEKRNDR